MNELYAHYLSAWDCVVACAFFALCLTAMAFWVRRAKAPALAFGVFAFARLGAIFVNTFIRTMPTDYFEQAAAINMQGGWAGLFGKPFAAGSEIYRSLICAIYLVAGRNPLLVEMLNLAFAAVAAMLMYLLARRLLGEKSATIWLYLFALMPFEVFNNIIIMREAIWLCLAIVGMYLLVEGIARPDRRMLLAAVAPFLAAFAIHISALPLVLVWLAACVLGPLLSARHAEAGSRRARWIGMAAAGVGIIALIFATGAYRWLENKLPLSSISGHALATAQLDAARCRAVYLNGIAPESLWGQALMLPVRMFYFLFAPFPPYVKSPLDLLGFADGLVFLALVILAIRQRAEVWRSKPRLVCAVAALALTAMFAVGVSNYGTAIRHRAKVLPLLLLVAAPPFIKKEGRE